MGKIKVIIKDPGKKPRCVHISDREENLKKYVGGSIKVVPIAADAVFLCKEEYEDGELPYNCYTCGIHFLGTIILSGFDGEKFCDLPVSYAEIKKFFPNLWKNVQ